MITAWRIVAAQWADDAFSGEGGRRASARWHSAPARIVYTSSSISLATLELLVHVQRPLGLQDYALVSCLFPEAIVEELDRARLPANWRDYPEPPELRVLGGEWLDKATSAVLAVPSAVTPEEVNYLINPEHEHFRSIEIGTPRPFHVDFRLLT